MSKASEFAKAWIEPFKLAGADVYVNEDGDCRISWHPEMNNEILISRDEILQLRDWLTATFDEVDGDE